MKVLKFENEESFLNKKEVVVDCYAVTLDIQLAYEKACLTREEMDFLDHDHSFKQRLTYFLVKEKEKIVSQIKTLMYSYDEKISLKAITDMGKYIYPAFFTPRAVFSEEIESIFTEEEAKRVREEYGKILGGSGHFKKTGIK